MTRYFSMMNFPPVRSLFAAALCCAVASCAMPHLPKWAKRKPVPKAMPIRFPKLDPSAPNSKRRQIGTILLVNAEAGFVLIEMRGGALPMPGAALKCIRDGADSGVLIVSGESQGSHVIADITTGTPRKGDLVFQ